MTQVNGNPSIRCSVLCVPAGDVRKVSKALASAADEVVIDLEDAVASEDKETAREHLSSFDWKTVPPNRAVAVRVNGVGTPWCHRDLEAVVGIPEIASVIVPKVESRADVNFVERLLDGLEGECAREEQLGVQALIETAVGVVSLADIVSDVRRLTSLVIGYADLAASLGRDGKAGFRNWEGVQDAILLHARAAGLVAVDGPYLRIADDDPFRDAVDHAAAFGFDAKWVIHPNQIGAVNDGFAPSPDRVDHAHRVLAALDDAASAGKGAAVVDGALVDEAMARDARRVLAKAVGR